MTDALRGHTVVVYCWCCGEKAKRDTLSALLARCDVCGSADTHVTRSLEGSRFTRADLAEMVRAHRAWGLLGEV